jgi:hypothetical protein
MEKRKERKERRKGHAGEGEKKKRTGQEWIRWPRVTL